MPSRDVELLLKARDEASAKIAALEKRLEAFDRKAKKSSSAAEATFQMGKVMATVGTLEAAFKGVTAVTTLFKGDVTEAAEQIKQMPMGIGPMATALEGMLATLTGHNEKLKEINDQLAEAEARDKARNALYSTLQEANDALEYRTKLDAAQSDAGREKIKLERELEKQIEHINKLIDQQLIGKSQIAQAEKTIQALKDETVRKVQEAYDRERQQVEELAQAKAEAIRKEQEAADKLEQQRIDAANRRAETLEDVESQIVQARLKAAGRADLAERVRIEESFKKRIEEAEKANDKELAGKLKMLEQLDLEESKKKHRESQAKANSQKSKTATPGELKATISHYAAGASSTRAEREQAAVRATKEVEKAIKEHTKVAKKQTQLLEKMSRGGKPKVASMGMV